LSFTLDEIEVALSENPKNAEAWKIKGDLLLEKTMFFEASKCFSKSILCDPNYLEAWSRKGLVNFLQNNNADAIHCFDKVIYQEEMNFETWRLKSHVYTLEKKNIELANKCINKALELDPQNLGILLSKALHLKIQGSDELSLQFFDKALLMEPNNLFSLINRDKIKHKSELKDNDPTTLFEKLKNYTKNFLENQFGTKSEDYSSLTKFGDQFLLQFDFETARSCYDLATDINPTDPNLLKKQCLVHLKFNDLPSAIDFISKSLTIATKDSDGWIRKGEIFRVQNKIIDSITCFDKALESDENNAEAWRRKGYSQRTRHEMANNAIMCFDKSLKLEPYHPMTWLQKAIF